MSEKKQSTAKTAVLITGMMLGFKVLGFVKQSVIAYFYGATGETDMFFIASGFIMSIIGALVSSLTIATVAEYTRVRIQVGKEEAAKVINGLFEIAVPISLVLIGLVLLLAPFISKLLAPAYEQEDLSVVAGFVRILAPSLFFICTQFTMAAVLDSHKAFVAPRLETFIYSSFSILACVFLSKMLGINALVYAQFAATMILSVILLISARKYHKFRFVNPKNNSSLKTILITAIPLFIGSSVLQINEIVDKAITSGLEEGATSSLYYSQTLDQFVTAVMVVNIGNVMLTNFAESVAKKEIEEVKSQLSKVVNLLMCLLIGVSVITILCAKDIVTIVFYRGSFTMEAVESSAGALAGYALAFAAVAVREMMARGLYAFQDSRKTMISSVISIAINITLSIIFSRFMGIFGIALATSISAFIGMVMNVAFLRKYIKDYPIRYHLFSALKCIPAAAIVGFMCYAVGRWVPGGAFVHFAICGFVGLLIYAGLLHLLRIHEISEAAGRILAKVKKPKA